MELKASTQGLTVHDKSYMEWDPRNRAMRSKFGKLDFSVNLLLFTITY